MELMVPIENKDSIPLYEQIYRYIKTEIRGRQTAGWQQTSFYQDTCGQSSCKQEYDPVGL